MKKPKSEKDSKSKALTLQQLELYNKLEQCVGEMTERSPSGAPAFTIQWAYQLSDQLGMIPSVIGRELAALVKSKWVTCHRTNKLCFSLSEPKP